MTPALTQWERDRWRQDAACRPDRRPEGMDPAAWTALFFPERGQKLTPALNICARCPVRAECRAAAECPQEREGIWGGLSAKQRKGHALGKQGPAYPPEVRAEERRLTDLGWTGSAIADRLGIARRTVYAWRRARNAQAAA